MIEAIEYDVTMYTMKAQIHEHLVKCEWTCFSTATGNIQAHQADNGQEIDFSKVGLWLLSMAW